MIQDIAPYQFDNRYTPEPPQPASYLLWYDSGRISLQQTGDTITFPRFSDLPAQAQPQCIYLFSIGEDRFYWLNQKTQPVTEPFTMQSIYALRTLQPRHYAYAGLVGFHLHNWYNRHRFCGRCGHRLAARYQRTHAALPQLRRHAVSADLPGGDHRCHPR